MTRDNQTEYSVAIVADGHGSDKYFRSDRGSKFAVEAAKTCIIEFVEEIVGNSHLKEKFLSASSSEEIILQLIKSIVAKWHGLINEDFSAEPFSLEEMNELEEKYKERYQKGEHIESAYGSTLIAVMATNEFWLGLHIGDGKCVVVDSSGNYLQPIPWDDKCFLSVTTSMSDQKVVENFRHKLIADQLPIATFVASDGIDDSFSTMDDDKQLYDFYNNIIRLFCMESIENAEKELSSYLPILSQKGSKDDISLAALLDVAAIKEWQNSLPPPPVANIEDTEPVESNTDADDLPTETAENDQLSGEADIEDSSIRVEPADGDSSES